MYITIEFYEGKIKLLILKNGLLIDNYNSLVSQLLKLLHKGHFGKSNGISFKHLKKR
jgi:hypothetical protein